jgi:hypothetical protein
MTKSAINYGTGTNGEQGDLEHYMWCTLAAV